MARSWKGFVNTRELATEDVCFHVLGASGAFATDATGKNFGTLTKNGTGDYTLAFTYPAKRILFASVLVLGTGLRAEVASAGFLPGSIGIKTFGYNNTTPTDAELVVKISLSYSSRTQ